MILGQVLTAAQGQNPARQASMAAGIPKEVPAWGVNQVCGSGLRAVALAAQAIATGDATIVVAGGQENMSLSPHAQTLRGGTKMGDVGLIDTMIKDGLTDVFNGYHMGITAENLAEQYQITRDEQDAFAAASQNKAAAARAAGRFEDEIAAGDDQGPQGRHDRRPGRISSATASTPKRSPACAPRSRRTAPSPPATPAGLNDGAAALVLMSREEAETPRRADPRPRRELGLGRRRSLDHGHRPGPGLEAARSKRPAGRSPTST